jgi:hypothetical protein
MSQTKAQLVEGLNINTSAPADALVINSSGNVGIGISSPDSTLELAAGPPRLKLTRNTTASTGNDFGRIVFENSVGTILSRIDCESTSGNTQSALTFSNGGSERLRIDSSGRLGIGTASPANKLHVSDTSGSAQIRITGSSGSSNIYADSNIYFQPNGSTAVTFASSGKVGIGCTPVRDFQLHTSDASSELMLSNSTTGATAGSGFMLQQDGNDNYIWNKENSFMSFGTNAAERMRIDSSGRLLVGSTSTSNTGLLCVKGNASSSTGAGQLTLQKGTGVTGADQELGAYNLGEGSASTAKIRAFTGANWTGSSRPTHLTFETTASGSSGPTERLRIDSSGNVGINNSSPGSYNSDGRNLVVGSGSGGQGLSIASGTSNYGTIYFADGTSGDALYRGAVLYNHGSDFMRFDTAAGERMRIDSSGNVGIGTTSMDGKLDIRGTTQIKHSNTNTSGLVSGLVLRQGSATNGNRLSLVFNSLDNHIVAGVNGVIETHSGSESSNQGRLEFYTKTSGSSVTERMRIDNTGKTILLGTSTNGVLVAETTQGAASNKNIIVGGHSASSIDGGTGCFVVLSNGNVVNTNNSYGALSDVKLKENIVNASSQWDDLKAIQVRNYNLKESTGQQTHTQLGVVAQEVELVSPGLVSESPDLDADGNDLGTVTKSVNYSVLYMKAVKALQEAIAKIETLETQNASLEARLTALEAG